MSDEYDYLFKCIVVGDGGCGKTALVVRFSQGFFQEQYKLTIGVEFAVKTIELLDGRKVKLQIWDTGGQERFTYVRPLYYRGSMGAILLFDLSNRESFEHLGKWMEEVRSNAGDVPMLLVGNKSDLVDDRVVPREEAEEFAQEFEMFYIESSAKDGTGVGDVFAILSCLMIGIDVPSEYLAGTSGLTDLSGKRVQAAASEEVVSEPEPQFEPEPEPQFEPEPEFSAPEVPPPVYEESTTEQFVQEDEDLFIPPVPSKDEVKTPPKLVFEEPPMDDSDFVEIPTEQNDELYIPPVPPKEASGVNTDSEPGFIEIPTPSFEEKAAVESYQDEAAADEDLFIPPVPQKAPETQPRAAEPQKAQFPESTVPEIKPKPITIKPKRIAKPQIKPTPNIQAESEETEEWVIPEPKKGEMQQSTTQPAQSRKVAPPPVIFEQNETPKPAVTPNTNVAKNTVSFKPKAQPTAAPAGFKPKIKVKAKPAAQSNPIFSSMPSKSAETAESKSTVPFQPFVPKPKETAKFNPVTNLLGALEGKNTSTTAKPSTPIFGGFGQNKSEQKAFVPFSSKEKKDKKKTPFFIPEVETPVAKPIFQEPIVSKPIKPKSSQEKKVPTFQPTAPKPGKKEKKRKKKKDIIICSNCGAMLSGKYKFCNKCGSKL